MQLYCVSTIVAIQNDSRLTKTTNKSLAEVGFSGFQLVNTHSLSTISALHKLTVSL